ncbi:MAG TPA: mannose-6-phosphate isomerase, class I [Leptospiraceae bacterium]|nr:mannose-6-phosphate isomerase, class I [Spirochaetaceae bacterium]HBS04680.1 mannose-6-phosphate isomerase, class I [Leptospiraceae bacterium]|tara:strand:- start:1507 stop:2715 length:1209 start_codon:yes stop_codon:yes gene_type:complete
MNTGSAFYPIFPALKDYAWGSQDPEGAIADLLRKNTGGEIPPGPYAELWYGDHPSGCSLLPDGSALNEQIAREPEHILGPFAKQGKLPYLLKILESQSPLSIQAHPDRELARTLHDRDPEHYPDSNHKPEIAICLRPGFTAMAGFQELSRIQQNLTRHPELQEILPGLLESNGNARQALKQAFEFLYRLPGHKIEEIARKLHSRIEASSQKDPSDSYFLRFCQLYGFQDPGLFSIFLLNLLQFHPGQSLFMGAREPHAYLQGAIIECMACSDNVVRGGLTPKFVDVDTLVDMLHYRMGPPDTIEPRNQGKIRIYQPPVEDFQVWTMETGAEGVTLPRNLFPVIALSLSGTARIQTENEVFELLPGRSVLLPAGSGNTGGGYSISSEQKADLVLAGPGQPTNL